MSRIRVGKVSVRRLQDPSTPLKEVAAPIADASPAEVASAPDVESPRGAPGAHPLHGFARDAAIGAAIDMTRAVLRKEQAGEVALHGVKAATKAVARNAVKHGLERVIVKETTEVVAKGVLRGVVRGSVVAEVSSALVEQGIDTVKLIRGDISGSEYGERSLQNVAGVGGSISGAYAGAAIGTMIVPGAGTVIGGVVGGFFGGNGARALIRKFFD